MQTEIPSSFLMLKRTSVLVVGMVANQMMAGVMVRMVAGMMVRMVGGVMVGWWQGDDGMVAG